MLSRAESLHSLINIISFLGPAVLFHDMPNRVYLVSISYAKEYEMVTEGPYMGTASKTHKLMFVRNQCRDGAFAHYFSS